MQLLWFIVNDGKGSCWSRVWQEMAGWLLRLVWFFFSRGRPVGGSSFRSKGEEKG